ncbi:MAG: elongation factor Ts [Clostridia bacterium]|nr:elongation factor Ts [Clostridia bacterium]
MANISAKDVQALRERTGVGMMKCKEALIATEGDMEKAVTFLREQGLAVAAKKATRIAAEGIISLYCENNVGVLVEVNSETDFVAKNPSFKEFADGVAKVIAENNPADVAALLDMKFPGTEQTVEEMRKEKILVIGENINIRRFAREEGATFCYSHGNGRIGVLVKFDSEGNGDFATNAKNVCMQIAAMTPAYMTKEDVPAEIIESEKEILLSQIKNDPKQANKPQQVIDKMITGKLSKYYTENVLLEQGFFFDDTITVGKALAAAGLNLVSYTRFEKGEGLQKREDNFAAEVAAAMSK